MFMCWTSSLPLAHSVDSMKSRLLCGAGDARSCRTASLLPEASFPDIISFKKDFSSGYWLSFLLRAELGAGCVVMFSEKLLFARNNHAENQQDFGFVFIFFMLL